MANIQYKNGEIVFVKLMDSEKYSGQFVKVELKVEGEDRNQAIFLSTLMPGGKPNQYFEGSKLHQLLTATETLDQVSDEFRGSRIQNNRDLMKLVNILKGKIVELSIDNGKVIAINPSAVESKPQPKSVSRFNSPTSKAKVAAVRPQLQQDEFDWGDLNG